MINKKGNQSDRTICAMNSRLQRADRQSLSKDNDSRPRASVFERLGSRHVSPLSSPQPQHHSNYYHDNNSHQHYRSNSKHRRGTVVSPAQQSASSSSFHGEYELHSRRSDEYHSTPQYHRNSSRSAGSTVALDINLSRSSRHSNHSADKISTRLPSMITHPMVCTSNNGSHNSHPGQSNPSSNHSQSKKRNTNADEDEGLEKRRIQIHKELEAMRTSNKTRPLSTRHRESGAVNYQSPCSQSSRSRWSSSSSSSSSGSGSYSSSSSGSCSRSGSSCSSARLNRKKSRKSTMRRPLDTSDASLRLSKRVSKTIGYTPPLSSSKDPVQVSPIDCRSRTPQSNSSSYYSRKSHALSPATPSQRSTHSQSPLPGSSTVFNKSNSLKFDRHGNIRVSLRDKERQRRAVPTYNVPTNSPLVSNNMILNRIVTSSPIFRPLSNSPQKSIEPQASSVATTKNVAPPPYLEQINRELNEKRLQENCNGRIQSSPKSTGEMSPISNCSLFGDEDAGKGIDLEDAEPGEILDMVNDASKIAGDRSLDSTRSSLKMHKDGAVIPNEPQNFSDWSDADDILDEIKQKSDEQLETISDDEFDPSMVEDLNRDGARDQLSGKQVLDILDIDWKSLVESKEKLEFVPGSARKRFLPGNVFAHIGISERLAGSTLIERVKQLCQQQSVDTFHTFHHPTGFLHRAIRRQSIAKACQDSGSFAFGSDLKYKQFLSTGRSVRLPLQRLLQPQSLQGRNNDSSNLIDKSVGTIDACE